MGEVVVEWFPAFEKSQSNAAQQMGEVAVECCLRANQKEKEKEEKKKKKKVKMKNEEGKK